jgi:sulfite exporter TauE/SafE
MLWQVIYLIYSWSFTFGLLHTLLPCEDKAIFGFHAFGVSKNVFDALKFVGVFALGVMTVNNLIGFGFAVLGNIFSLIPFMIIIAEYISPVFCILLGAILYYRLVKYHKGDDHQASPYTLKVRKNLLAIYLLGILTGLPPCPFEYAMYVSAFTVGASGFYYGVLNMFLFTVGTVLGLFILALILRSFKEVSRFSHNDLVQKVALIVLIGFGTVALVLAIFGFPIIIKPVPQIT